MITRPMGLLRRGPVVARRAHSLSQRYDAFLAATVGGQDDAAQRAVIARLATLHDELVQHQWKMVRASDFLFSSRLPAFAPRGFGSSRAPRGLYICGTVGTGKTAMMDLFIEALAASRPDLQVVGDTGGAAVSTDGAAWRIRRTHFHRFMLDVHQRIHRLRLRAAAAGSSEDGRDPLVKVAVEIAREAPLICFDEFQVTDVADAAILHRLFAALFSHGAVVVATSNRRPRELYENGINRFLFLPFLDLLEERCATLDMAAVADPQKVETTAVAATSAAVAVRTVQSPRDYREWAAAAGRELNKLGHRRDPPRFLRATDPGGAAAFDALFASFSGPGGGGGGGGPVTLRVAHGRTLVAAEASADGTSAARFTFTELFEVPRGAADFIALAGRFGALFVSGVPALDPTRHNEARRFITFVDVVYEEGGLLVLLSEGAALQQLFMPRAVDLARDSRVDRDAMVEVTDTHAVDAPAARGAPVRSSSSSSSQEAIMPCSDCSKSDEGHEDGGGGGCEAAEKLFGPYGFEVTASGPLSVSVAEYSAVADVGFAFARCLSRLVEMQTPQYLDAHTKRWAARQGASK